MPRRRDLLRSGTHACRCADASPLGGVPPPQTPVSHDDRFARRWRRRDSCRAQLQSLETIAIVIILLLVLLLGGFLFINATKGDAANTARKYQVQRAEAIVATLSDLPELRCPSYGASTTPCLDLLAVGILGAQAGDTHSADLDQEMRLSYHGVFGDSYVEVQKLYPDVTGDPAMTYILYNATTSENVYGQDVPVVLFDARTNTYKLGVVHVETQ